MKAPSAGSTLGTGSSRGRFGCVLACLLVLCAFAGSSAPSAVAAVLTKGVTGFFGSSGGDGGQLNSPAGVAVNQATGNVYTADSTNHRISVFNSAGTFLRAFGQDVVQTGPGNNGSGYEICVPANGDFCKAGIATASTGGAMQAPQGVAIDAAGNVFVSEQNKLRVQKFDANGNFLLAFGRNVVAAGPGNGGAGAVNEVQSIAVKASSGTFKLTFEGQTTAALPFDVPASGGAGPTASVENALNALTSIAGFPGGGSVSVTGGPGDPTGSNPYAVTFGGALANTNVTQIALDATGLAVPVGTPLSCSSATSATTTNFQWLTNGAASTGPGATTANYTTVAADAGKAVQCQVFKINANAGATQISTPPTVIAPAPATALPISTASVANFFVTVSGSLQVGSNPGGAAKLTCTTETGSQKAWSGANSLTYQWYRNAVPLSGNGADSQVYTVQAADLSSATTFQCATTATNAGGSVSKVSPYALTTPKPTEIPGGEFSTPEVTVPAFSAATTTTQGVDVFEVCSAAAGDVCRGGVAGAEGGAFANTFSGQLTVAPASAPNAGDVLVADPGNRRVQEFGPAGAFVRAFGFDVTTGAPTTFEVCAVGPSCKAGVTGNGSGQFATNTPTRVAEDASGNVYTVEPVTNFRVQKFTLPGNVVTPQGAYDAADLTGTSTTAPLAVAIDPATQDLLVAKAFAAGATPSCPVTGAASVAERRVLEIDPTLNAGAGGLAATHMACAGIAVANGLAMRSSAASGDVYVASTTGESRLYVLNAGQPVAPTVGFSGVSAITAHSATVSGFVNPGGPNLPYGTRTTYHVNYKRSSDPAFSQAPVVDADAGNSATNQVVSQQLPNLEAGTSYDVQIVATKPFGSGSATTATFSFSTPSSAPTLATPTATSAATETGARAALYGRVNPNGQATTYRFEYGTTTSYGASAPVPDASLGAGGTAIPVAQFVSGLDPSTTYHYRLLAKNASGGSVGPDHTFTTPPLGSALPDGRAFEQVSPNDKRPAGTVSTFLPVNLIFQASDDGDKVIYPLLNGLSDATTGGELEYMAKRAPGGWLSTQLSAPALVHSFREVNATGRVIYSSPSLSCTVLESSQPLTADTPAADLENGVVNLYLRDSTGSYTLLSKPGPTNPSASDSAGFVYSVDAASPDCSHILFESKYSFLPGGPSSGFIPYEWSNGSLRLAGVRPDGSIDAEAQAGGKDTTINSISANGSRVIFTGTSNEGVDIGKKAIFVRKNATTTVNISRSRNSDGNANGARFEGATPDGSHVYFLARYGLAARSSQGSTSCRTAELPDNVMRPGEGCDLYDYNVDTETLTDLSVDTNPADSLGAAVVGMVDASEDGSYVYFAARGQLVPGEGNTQAQNQLPASGAFNSGAYNIYLNHDGQLSFVGRMTGKEAAKVQSGGMNTSNDFESWAADATPSGKHLLFLSRANVTGYPSGSVTQAYRYSAATDSTVCISCRTDGLPSVGSSKTAPITYQNIASWGPSAKVPRRPRSIADDGSRVFFTMPDVLAPGAQIGARNIYEWEEGRVHLLLAGKGIVVNIDSLYVDSSASGDDVFLRSKSQLVPQDFDTTNDLYDARVGGGFPYQPPPVPCDILADQCQDPPAPQPGPAEGGSTEAFSGPGNASPQPAAKKAKHKKKHKHRQRKRGGRRHGAGTAGKGRTGDDRRAAR